MYAIYSTQLSVLDVLFREREKQLKQAINDLQLRNVNDDDRFKAAVDRIKQQILLEPVTIGEPKITG